MPRVAVILSSGRTGTQFLARYFDANYPEVVARHEPSPSRLIRVLSNAAASGAMDRAKLRPWLTRLRGRRLATLPPETALYLESNGLLYGFAEVLPELWPEVSIVHVVRDPREQIRSALAHGNDRGLKRLAGALVPWWHPNPRGISGLEPATPESGLIGRYAVSWRVINQTIENARSVCPRLLRLRFEELVDPEASGVRRLCEHLGLPFQTQGRIAPDQRFNVSKRASVGDWRSWSAAECRAVDASCRELMQEYGYGDEPEWRAKLEQRAETGSPSIR